MNDPILPRLPPNLCPFKSKTQLFLWIGCALGRLSYVFLWVSCLLARLTIISPESYHNFTRFSTSFRQNIELEHLKKGSNHNSAFPQVPQKSRRSMGRRPSRLSVSRPISLSLSLSSCMCIYIYIYLYLYLYLSLYVYIYIYMMNIYIYIHTQTVYVCVYVCMYNIYIYI